MWCSIEMRDSQTNLRPPSVTLTLLTQCYYTLLPSVSRGVTPRKWTVSALCSYTHWSSCPRIGRRKAFRRMGSTGRFILMLIPVSNYSRMNLVSDTPTTVRRTMHLPGEFSLLASRSVLFDTPDLPQSGPDHLERCSSYILGVSCT